MPIPSPGRVPTFEELARASDDAIELVLGAALIAKDVYVDLDVRKLLERFDDLAGPLDEGSLEGLSPAEQAAKVSERFRELGFRGNVEEYYDARNSLLPDVLERRTGIPITLTLVWCELARRAGVLARGVGFPGHFLARVDDARAESTAPIIVDPFGGGHVLTTEETTALLRRSLGPSAELHPVHLAPATARETMVRMLTNLKAVWAAGGDHPKAFVAVDRIVTLVPDSARMLRERASVALLLGMSELARADLTRVLELEPRAPDVPMIERRLRALRRPAPTAPN